MIKGNLFILNLMMDYLNELLLIHYRRFKNKRERKETLSAALITAVYTFDKTIYGIKNPEGKLSKSKKTVFLRHTVWDVLQDNSLMNNSIRFTP